MWGTSPENVAPHYAAARCVKCGYWNDLTRVVEGAGVPVPARTGTAKRDTDGRNPGLAVPTPASPSIFVCRVSCPPPGAK